MPRRFAFLLAAVVLATAGASAQPVTLDAVIVEAEAGRPLPGATVQIEGTARGAAADRDGRLRLTLDRLPATVVVRFVGYVTERVEIARSEAEGGVVRRTFRLRPDRVQLGELEVTDENAAVGIMRRVLRRKAELSRKLGAYAAEAYTWFTLHRQGDREAEPALVRLTESLSNVYWRSSAGGREEVVARRRVPEGKPFAYAAPDAVPDFYFADAVELDGQRLPTPTHPDALARYDFKIGAVTEEDGRRLIDIAVTPTQRSGLIGRVRVVDSLFVLAEADLRLADPPRRDFVTASDARYRVTFAPVTDSLWLPATFERSGYVEVGTRGSRLPRVDFRQATWLGRFAPGRPGPASLWQHADRYYAPAGLYAGDEVYRSARARGGLSTKRTAKRSRRWTGGGSAICCTARASSPATSRSPSTAPTTPPADHAPRRTPRPLSRLPRNDGGLPVRPRPARVQGRREDVRPVGARRPPAARRAEVRPGAQRRLARAVRVDFGRAALPHPALELRPARRQRARPSRARPRRALVPPRRGEAEESGPHPH
jgi:hypothetical protein